RAVGHGDRVGRAVAAADGGGRLRSAEEEQRRGQTGRDGQRSGQPAGAGERAVERAAVHDDEDPLVPSPCGSRANLSESGSTPQTVWPAPIGTKALPLGRGPGRKFVPNLDESD